jgi:hypothetical protein
MRADAGWSIVSWPNPDRCGRLPATRKEARNDYARGGADSNSRPRLALREELE